MMYVVKRGNARSCLISSLFLLLLALLIDGHKEKVAFDKITARIAKLCYGLDNSRIDPVIIAQKV